MKIKSLFIITLWICNSFGATESTPIIKAIDASDPLALRYLLITGFSIKAEEKKQFLAHAQEVTNTTYAHLHKTDREELLPFMRGAAKVIMGMTALYASYNFYNGYWNISQFAAQKSHGGMGLVSYALEARQSSYIATGFGLTGAYFCYKGMLDWINMLLKKKRFQKHCSALAVEAILQRLPVTEDIKT